MSAVRAGASRRRAPGGDSGEGLGEFGAVFDRYFAEIRYVARRLGPEVADDVAAETFETAFRKRSQFDAGRGTVRAWLYGVATRQMGRHRRREARHYQALGRTAPPLAAALEELVADRVSAQAAGRQLAVALVALEPGWGPGPVRRPASARTPRSADGPARKELEDE